MGTHTQPATFSDLTGIPITHLLPQPCHYFFVVLATNLVLKISARGNVYSASKFEIRRKSDLVNLATVINSH